MLVGNDIVDLGDPEAALDSLHPRFVARVFTEAERRAIERSPDPRAELWAYWAAKESAYKALKKLDPHLVFAHSTFVVNLDSRCGQARRAGTVSHGSERLLVAITTNADWVHAVATDEAPDRGGVAGCRLIAHVSRSPAACNQSDTVRLCARRVLAQALDHTPRDLSVVGSRPPRLRVGDRLADLDLSLSHHGRWVSFAALVPLARID